MKNFLLLIVTLVVVCCWFSCEKENQYCIEDLDPDCICTLEYDPVCGCNNVTYGNPCQAECANISDYTPGPCN